MPAAPLRDREHSDSGRNVPFLSAAWVGSTRFWLQAVCTLKHLFNIKEAACAAVIVRPERVPLSSKALNESSPRGQGTDDSCGVYTRAYSPRASDPGLASGPTAAKTPGGAGKS